MLGHLEAMLGRSWPLLPHLDPRVAHLSRMLGHLDPILAPKQRETQKLSKKHMEHHGFGNHLGATLCHLGAILRHLGAILPIGGYVGPSWGLCWPILGAMFANLRGYVGPTWTLFWAYVCSTMLAHLEPQVRKNGESKKHRKTRDFCLVGGRGGSASLLR